MYRSEGTTSPFFLYKRYFPLMNKYKSPGKEISGRIKRRGREAKTVMALCLSIGLNKKKGNKPI